MARIGQRAAGACLAAATALLAAGCTGTGTNGVGGGSPQDTLQRAEQAVASASSVHVTGNLLNDGQPTQLDVVAAGPRGGEGTITTAGQTFQILRVGTAVYMKGDAALYAQLPATSSAPPSTSGPVPSATADPGDAQKYVLIPPSNRFYALIVRFTTANELFDDALPASPSLAKDGQKTVGGQTAMVLSFDGGEVDVALDGPPYPLEVRLPESSTSGGVLDFADFSAPVSLQTPAPADVLDLGKLNQEATAVPPTPVPPTPVPPAPSLTPTPTAIWTTPSGSQAPSAGGAV